GGQLVVMGRFSGKGPSAIRLTGMVGKEEKEFVYELTFPDKTEDGREFVEQLWARRKVGFLLDQIRINGEKKELKDEVVALAKKYGITTPYTSYLIVPDGPLPRTPGRPGGRVPLGRVTRAAVPPGLMPPGGAGGFGGRGAGAAGTPAPPASKPVLDLARKSLDDRVKLRGEIADKELKEGKKAE